MRWCCGGLSEARGSIATANGGGGGSNNGRRQQLTIQGDQVVLDATTAAALNNLHQGPLKDEPRPSTSSEAYQFSSTSDCYGGGGGGRYKSSSSSTHPVSTGYSGGRKNSEGKIIFDNNQESIFSSRNAALIMDKYGPMLLRPCKSVSSCCLLLCVNILHLYF
uniref:Uncharacterized protein n=1 Tax=Panagrolaimus sp. ES5 TaxID=591445 RepID=A0AC34F0V9_9BILA